jgi:hypothetical protein
MKTQLYVGAVVVRDGEVLLVRPVVRLARPTLVCRGPHAHASGQQQSVAEGRIVSVNAAAPPRCG